MSTSTKTPASIRQRGPGASHENAKAPLQIKKPPPDLDLRRNPLIGGSKGATMAGVTPDELEESQGANTVEGDVENDVNPQGGIDKAVGRNARRTPHV